MNIHVKTTSERPSKNGGDECVNIDLFGEKEIMLGRLVLREDPAHKGKYRLAEDVFFRSPRLSIHAFEKQEDSPLQEVTQTHKCWWCNRRATHKDWREIDGTTGSTLECDVCAKLDTAYLLEREAKREQKRKKSKLVCGHTKGTDIEGQCLECGESRTK
jgi:hypothetical protein